MAQAALLDAGVADCNRFDLRGDVTPFIVVMQIIAAAGLAYAGFFTLDTAKTLLIALPGLATARPVTLTTTLKNYGGDGAYLAVYLTDPSGAYVRTLWVAGKKSKYYKHLSDWHRAIDEKLRTLDSLYEFLKQDRVLLLR